MKMGLFSKRKSQVPANAVTARTRSKSILSAPPEVPEAPQKIIGYGSSPLVACESRGLYFIQVDDHAVQIELYPQARSVRDAWQWYADGELVTELDAETAVSFKLKLPGYQPIELTDIPGTYSFPLIRKTDGISVN